MVRQRGLIAVAALAAACTGYRGEVEDPDAWFDDPEDYYVQEPVQFTDVNYDFPTNANDGIGALLEEVFPAPAGSAGRDTLVFGEADAESATDGCNVVENDALPFEVEGIVTAHPRFYFKSSGCDWDSEEKYYGSFFIQDATGGLFVLGDTKVARFDMGDRVRILVRGVKTSFELDMAYTYDLLEIVERGQPIFYEETDEALGCDRTAPIDWEQCDVGRVKRVTGMVIEEKDTFGEFGIMNEDGVEFRISLDVELNRRGLEFPVGTRIQVTGPVLYSYGSYNIIVMRVGQVEVLD